MPRSCYIVLNEDNELEGTYDGRQELLDDIELLSTNCTIFKVTEVLKLDVALKGVGVDAFMKAKKESHGHPPTIQR